MLWHQNSGAKPLPLNSGAMAFLVPNSILLTWHHFWSLAPRVWHHDSQCSKSDLSVEYRWSVGFKWGRCFSGSKMLRHSSCMNFLAESPALLLAGLICYHKINVFAWKEDVLALVLQLQIGYRYRLEAWYADWWNLSGRSLGSLLMFGLIGSIPIRLSIKLQDLHGRMFFI
ncbi:hypothetical protein Tco_0893685 [Tanacetum coccineum]|uniref:Uncharacterized protein n=1 Tax=Tanacetum coccineum TaxID=301880 RepID=A0ABQ5CCC7_9ASTR